MRSMLLPVLWCAVLFGGCQIADFYEGDDSYVLYDSSVPPAPGSEERAAGDEDPLAADVSPAAAAPAVIDANLRRAFALEAALDELRRAIPDKAGDPDVLEARIREIEAELRWRKALAGERYASARDLRLDALLSFPVQTDPPSDGGAPKPGGDG